MSTPANHSRSTSASQLETARALELSACPCGVAAFWYRIILVPITWRGGIEIIAVNDYYDDLCEGCFVETVAPYERTGWVRVS